MSFANLQIEPPLHMLLSDGRHEASLVRDWEKRVQADSSITDGRPVTDANGGKVGNRELAAALLQSRHAQASLAESLKGNPAKLLSLLRQTYVNLGALIQLDHQDGQTEIIASLEEALLMQKPHLRDLGIQVKIPSRSISIVDQDKLAIFLESFAAATASGKPKALTKEGQKFLENFFGEITQTIYSSFARFQAGEAEKQQDAGEYLGKKYSKLIPALEAVGVNVDDLKLSIDLARKGYLREYVLATNMLYEASDLIHPYVKDLSVEGYRDISSHILGTLDDLLENKTPDVRLMLKETVIPRLIEAASGVNAAISAKYQGVPEITETFLRGLNLRLGQVTP